MRFIKQNLFLVILLGILAVAAVGLGLVTMGVGADVEAAMGARVQTSAKIDQWDRRDPVNARLVESQEQRLAAAIADAERVRQECIEWNRRAYDILQLEMYDGETRVGEIAAFPIDREKYERYSLRYRCSQKYIEAMNRLRGSLRPASQPTADELAEEARRVQQELDEEKDREERRLMHERLTSGGATTGLGPVAPARTAPATPGRPNEVKAITISPKAQSIAQYRVARQHAMRGWVHVAPNAMDMQFEAPTETASDRELWMAHVNLWVTHDIVKAIEKTIGDAFATKAEGERNVLNSPVKKLVKIEVDNRYAGAPPDTALPEPSGERGRSSSAYEAYEDTSSAKNPLSAPTLTRRGSNPMYDVIRYNFTVVMPWSAVINLQKNLTVQNFHTILNVQQQAPTLQDAKSTRDLRDAKDAKELYYYGDEPVVEVTFEGELLLLAAWERGTPEGEVEVAPARRGRAANDASAAPITWKLPPLMPVDVLRDLPSTALRDADRARLQQETPRTGY